MEDPILIAAQFDLGEGVLSGCKDLGAGHIHNSFVVVLHRGAETRRYVLQRINTSVFPDVDALMSNFRRVTDHLKSGRSAGERSLELINTRDGADFYRDPDTGDCWRAFPFIEDTISLPLLTSPTHLQQVAYAFGDFARRMSSLPPPRLHEVLPDFHHTHKRFADFAAAVEADPQNRAAGAEAEIDAAMSGAGWVKTIDEALTSGAVPERIAHNDAKIENVLFDAENGCPVCVVDLDTVMPGSVLHDFGDLVRSAAATCAEDEIDIGRVGVSMIRFESLAEGYLSGCGGMLSEGELELLPAAGRVITYEQGLRFLTDHLLGDRYYKTGHLGHNLERARNQLRLAEVLAEHETEMTAAISRLR